MPSTGPPLLIKARNATYCLSLPQIDEVSAEDTDYIPTEEDILLCRQRTTGIVTKEFMIDGA